MRKEMKKLFFISLIMITMLLSHTIIWAQPITEYQSPSKVTIYWTQDDPLEITYYEVQLMRNDINNTIYAKGTTSEQQLQIVKPKSGKYIVMVRAVKVIDSVPTYSDWALSTDDTALLKDGTLGKWKIYWKPSTPMIMIIK
jgi:hypothetical protein